MHRYLLLLVLILWLSSCESSEPNVGIGLLHIENEFTTVLEFYDNPVEQGPPVFIVNVVYEEDSVITKSSLKKEDILKFRPIYLSSRKSVLVLQVQEEMGEWLRVVTDENNRQQHWVRAQEMRIESWTDFLKSVYRVRPRKSDQNPLRKTPKNGEVLPLSFQTTCFSVTSVNGDWVRVENRPGNCPEPGISNYPYAGFLRWKQDDNILINFGL